MLGKEGVILNLVVQFQVRMSNWLHHFGICGALFFFERLYEAGLNLGGIILEDIISNHHAVAGRNMSEGYEDNNQFL